MHKTKVIFSFAFASFISTLALSGQNNTNSPYTRFGYGSIADIASGEQRAMGGISLGTRSNRSISAANPASYSAVDSLTFMFDLGTSALLSRFADGNLSKTTFNANIEYITMQFRLFKGMGFSTGLLPYSFVGYNFSSSEQNYLPSGTDPSVNDTITATKTFLGTGGLNQVYVGLSYNFFNYVSLGVNAYYLFGGINHDRYLTFSSADAASGSAKDVLNVSDFRLRYGLQLHNTFGTKHQLTLGVIYENKSSLDGKFSTVKSGALSDEETFDDYKYDLPETFGAGLFYIYDEKLSLGADFSLQRWSKINFGNNSEPYNDRWKVAVGAEYQPDGKGRKILDRMKYRLGLNTSSSYYNINGKTPANGFGITFGIGLPLNKSMVFSGINAAVEYGKLGTNRLLSEDYFKLTFNICFNETWFFKRKL
ncbi:MAG: hypothetical protein LBH80_02485 [Prevotellaceae bacterium]|jgi:hypothetical protein|nr:hypothetical protein [Prevotellaceae bacterium]